MARRPRERRRPVPPPDNREGSQPDAAGASYPIGYKKPPLDTRFQRGQSGNPRGRPKGALGGGKQRAKLKRLLDKALQGDTRAASRIINIVARLLEQAETEDDVAARAKHGASEREQEKGGQTIRTRTRTRER